MMTISRQALLLTVALAVGGSAVNAFSVSPSAVARTSLTSFRPQGSTCLWAEEQQADADSEVSEEEIVEAGESSAGDSSANDILNSPAFLQRKLEVLESDVEKIEQEIAEADEALAAGKAEWESQFDALDREYSNIKDRMAARSEQGDAIATAEIAGAILELLDNFERGFGVVNPETDEEKAIDAKYRQLYADIIATFEKLGVQQVETVGKEFDYEVHQAIMQRPVPDFEEGIVCEEYQKGFILGEKLIRPAMVAVAA